jgi:NAD(P)-dependent dehydrogenase (short-subunit alcohol dehydrogenase family)
MAELAAVAELAGQHAVVTGGSRGIGAAVAAALLRLGASVTIVGRDRRALERQLETLASGAVRMVVADVTDQDAVERGFAAAAELAGAPTILVNNAGAARSAPFARTDRALWREMLDVNLTAAYRCASLVLPRMLEVGYGRIVNVASTAGLVGYPYVTAYCAAKHGLVGLTRSLALETATTGVTVNAVCPGFADTDLVARAVETIQTRTGRTLDEARTELTRHNPQGRLVRPEEVASAVGWLCLPGSAAVTGQSIVVAGGEVM